MSWCSFMFLMYHLPIFNHFILTFQCNFSNLYRVILTTCTSTYKSRCMGTNVSRIRLTLAFCIFFSPCSQNQIEATTRSQTLTSICWALLLFSSMMSLVVLWSFSTSAWSCKIACWALLRASLSYGHISKIGR